MHLEQPGPALCTDIDELTMAAAYFERGKVGRLRCGTMREQGAETARNEELLARLTE